MIVDNLKCRNTVEDREISIWKKFVNLNVILIIKHKKVYNVLYLISCVLLFIILNIMAKKTVILTPKVKKILLSVGEQIKLAWLRRKLSAELVSERAGISFHDMNLLLKKRAPKQNINTKFIDESVIKCINKDDFCFKGKI